MKNKLLKDFENQFLCGLLVTDKNRKIVFANQFFYTELAWNQSSLVGQPIETIMTKSSIMFYESYVVPVLIAEKRFPELQLTLLTGTGDRLSIVASVKQGTENQELFFWTFLNASNRNKLYEELIQTQETLSIQAKELTLLAITDELTGLFNRRELNRRAIFEIERSKRLSTHLSLLIIDIDNFKTINDSFGHDQGDIVLSALSNILNSEARKTDLVARIGGEEFAILLPDIDRQQACIFTQRLHAAIKAAASDIRSITVSIGISELSQTTDNSFDQLFKNADNALYKGKNSGRNKTVIYTLPLN
ncbi:MAG: diguanylate cyclase (GGDEF)-like protein [Paraglaciecola sp.]